jgi:hypothetical protein
MPLGDQRQPGSFTFRNLSQRGGQIRTVFDRAEVTARARAEPMTELVDGPQIEAGRVQREAVSVVDARVLTEAVEEDDGGPWLLGGPMAVVSPALWVIDERHAHDCSRWCAARARLRRSLVLLARHPL